MVLVLFLVLFFNLLDCCNFRERLDDVFKFKRERWKSFSKYVKEFHKRKERIHREKIDRIQREKINLLKINDVEGYLRMVQVWPASVDFTDLKSSSLFFFFIFFPLGNSFYD